MPDLVGTKERFDELDRLLDMMILPICSGTRIPVRVVSDIYATILIGKMHGRRLFAGRTRVRAQERLPHILAFLSDPTFFSFCNVGFIRAIREEIISTFIRRSSAYIGSDAEKRQVICRKLGSYKKARLGIGGLVRYITTINVRYGLIVADICRDYTYLVARMAKKYAMRGHEESVHDCRSHGNVGLMKAASYYTQQSGTPFESYAQQWIRQSILARIKDEGNTIWVPPEYWRRARILSEMDPADLDANDAQVANLTNRPVSLDMITSCDEKSALSEVIAGQEHVSADAEHQISMEHVTRLLEKCEGLTSFERVALICRAGLFTALPGVDTWHPKFMPSTK